MSNAERRAFPRTETEIHCKLRRSARTLFNAGRTLDLSASGASLELTSPRTAKIGERVAIAFSCITCPVTKSAKMIGASVVRVGPVLNGRQEIAIAFDAPQRGLEGLQLPMAA
jgi:hypothetical protein